MNKKLLTLPLILAPLALLNACGGDADTNNQQRGVSDTEIRIGSYTDLSGPVASWGSSSTNGQRMRYDEINAAGGIHGRKIKFFAEDMQYQLPVAVKAANKLLNVDDVFAMVGNLGTPQNIAIMPRQFDAGVPNLFPFTAAEQMYEPFHPMKFSYFVSYGAQASAGIKALAKQTGAKKVCLQTIANDYGVEVKKGYDHAVKDMSLESVYTGRHKATETDFVGTVTSIKNSGCELLALGPIIKDAILLYTSLRKAGWQGAVVSNMVPHTDEVARAAGGKMHGLYVATQLRLVDFDKEAGTGSWLESWHDRYVAKFGKKPNIQAQIGYLFADLLGEALEAAGPDLSTDGLIKALEGIKHFEDKFGGTPVSFGPDKHKGGDTVNLYQLQQGKWAQIQRNLSE